MAAGTVAYTDTTGNKDYLGMIAGQIGRRLREASDMASDERSFAERKAEEGGTSLEEAGIGKGYFFKRALGSRFGGDRIARTKGRMGMGGAGTDPTGNFRSRFRGGFDYSVTNEIQNSVTTPVTGALVTGLRGVENGLIQISQSLNVLGLGMNDLARAQQETAKQAILNGAFMQAFLNHMQREAARGRARNEERGLERRGFGGGRGGGFGGSGRGMINVTPPKTSGGNNISGALGSFATSQGLGKKTLTQAAVKGVSKKLGPKLTQSAVKSAGKKIADNTIGTASRTITKQLAPKTAKALPKVTTGAGKLLGKNTDDILKALGASGAKTKIAGFLTGFTPKALLPAAGQTGIKKAAKMVDIVDLEDVLFKNADIIGDIPLGAEDIGNLFKNPEELMNFSEAKMDAIKFGGGSRAEALMDIRLKTGGMIDNADEAARIYADLVTGGGLAAGAKFTQKEADGILKSMMSANDYAKYTKVANQPMKQAAKSTFTHKLLKAPNIQKQVAKTGAKTAAKTGGKALLRSGLKKIPVIAGLAGIAFGIQRALEGDLLGAGLEITSGILGATGVGGGLGLAIDGFLLGRDLGMMPLKKGVVATGSSPVPAVFGEAGLKEAALPLEGAEGIIAGTVFGDAAAEALATNFFTKRSNFVYSGVNNPNEASNILNNTSAKTGMGQMIATTTVINNNYAVAQGGSGGESSDSKFPTGFAAYNAQYSLASK